jgi:hypothetical protein
MKISTVAETAVRWGISPARVKQFLALDLVRGAQKMGAVWVIPAHAACPKLRKKRKPSAAPLPPGA